MCIRYYLCVCVSYVRVLSISFAGFYCVFYVLSISCYFLTISFELFEMLNMKDVEDIEIVSLLSEIINYQSLKIIDKYAYQHF